MRLSTSAQFLVAAMLLLLPYCLSAQTIGPDDLANPVDISGLLYGFNGEYMMDQCVATDDVVTNPPQPFSSIHLDESCRILVDELNPGLIRFPGGMTANYFHYYGTGYGYNPNETTGTLITEAEIALDGLMPVNFIEPFADLALQTNSRVIYTINIFTHFKPGGESITNPASEAYQWRFQENMDAIAYLMDRGVDLVAIELGNELYSFAEFTSIFFIGTAVGQYLTLAEAYTDAIKAQWPQLKVGVPVAIHAGFGNKFWNEQMQLASFADAVIPHEYERKVNSQCNKDDGREAYFNCARQTVEQFFDTDLEETVALYAGLYPGKELWLTEWGMSQPHGIANTFFDAWFVFRYWNKIMEIQKDFPGVVTITNRHNLITGGYLYPAFSRKLLAESNTVLYQGDKAIRASAYAHKLVSNLFDGSHQFIGHARIDSFDTWFYTQDGNSFQVAIINEHQEVYPLHIAKIAAVLRQSNVEFTTLKHMKAPQFYSAAGINYYAVQAGEVGLVNQLLYGSEDIAGSEIAEIAPLSLNVLDIAITETQPFALSGMTVELANCQADWSWTVTSDEAGIDYIAVVNGVAVDTLPSAGPALERGYTLQTGLSAIDSFTFEIMAIRGSDTLATASVSPQFADCAPAPELTEVTLQRVSECRLEATWTINHDVAGLHKTVLFYDEGGVLLLSEQMTTDGTAAYTRYFDPESNGVYSVTVALELADPLGDDDAVDCLPEPDPALASFTAQTDGESCEVSLSWTVLHETLPASYNILAAMGSGDLEVVGQVDAAEAGDSIDYAYTYTPAANGEYRFAVERTGDVTFSASPATVSVSCVPVPEPEVVSFTAVEAGNCSIAISWSTQNENAEGQYELLVAADGGAFESISFIDAVAGESSTYNEEFPPAANGAYSFRIIRHENGEGVPAAPDVPVDIACLPAFLSWDFSAQGECGFLLSWEVSSETATAVYTVETTSNGTTWQDFATVPSSGQAETAAYDVAFTPVTNGNHTFRVRRSDSGSPSLVTDNLLIEVACLAGAQPEILSTELITLARCQYDLFWSVANETVAGHYEVAASLDGGPFDVVAAIYPDDIHEVTVHGFRFTPETNGAYRLRVQRLVNDEVQTETETQEFTANCVIETPASFASIYAEAEADCGHTLYWTVNSETAQGSYEVLASRDGGQFQSMGTLAASGEAAQAVYSFPFSPGVDGSYMVYVKRFESGLFQAMSPIAFMQVDCPGEPAITRFSAEPSGECGVDLNWSVTDDEAGGVYSLWLSVDGGQPVLVKEVPATSGASVDYSYPFAPHVNGAHSFSVSRSSGTQAGPAGLAVACVPDAAPAFSSFSVVLSPQCRAMVIWNVDQETADGQYRVMRQFEGDSPEIVAEVASNGELETTSYLQQIDHDYNGDYTYYVERTGIAGYLRTDDAFLPVACLDNPDPRLESFEPVVNENCDVELQWTATGVGAGSEFHLYGGKKGDLPDFLAAVPATAGQQSYSWTFAPPQNGSYIFRMEIREDGMIADSEPATGVTVSCVPVPEIGLRIMPSVTVGPFRLRVLTTVPLTAELRIVHATSGFLAHAAQLELQQGNNLYDYDMTAFPGVTSGLYQVSVIYPGGTKWGTLMFTP